MQIIPRTCKGAAFCATLLIATLVSGCAGNGNAPLPAPTLTPTGLATPTATPPPG